MQTDIYHVLTIAALGYSAYLVVKDDIKAHHMEIQACLAGVQFLLLAHKVN